MERVFPCWTRLCVVRVELSKLGLYEVFGP
jgi:hypothetical protein